MTNLLYTHTQTHVCIYICVCFFCSGESCKCGVEAVLQLPL